jgi:hypothetical protein
LLLYLLSLQTREKIAIVEVEKDEYLQKLQRTIKEVKHLKIEVKEQMGLKRALKTKVSSLEAQLRDQQESMSSPEASAEVVSELRERVGSPEKQAEEFFTSFKDLEAEKQELMSQLSHAQETTEVLIQERDDLQKKLNAALQLNAIVASETQANFPSCIDRETKPARHIDRSVQVDTLADVCSQYRQQVEESNRELAHFKEETKRNNSAFHEKVRDTGAKILQLLDIKEQLTKKNNDLQKKIEELELNAPEYEVALNGNAQELHQSLANGYDGEALQEQLQRAHDEMKEMKQTHLNEKLAMKQRLSDAISKVREREAQQAEEISSLQTKLEKTQKRLQEVSNAAVANTIGSANIPDSLVSFREVEDITQYKLDEGAWGATVEAVFRGSKVAVRCVKKLSLARFPIQTIHKQIHNMAYIRHPRIAVFIAAAMDAPGGIMMLMEHFTCSLRQAYQSSLIKTDKLPILLDVASALNFLHLEKKPIVHNNLSSQCVLVEEGVEGQWSAKLSDMGTTTSLVMVPGPGERENVYLPPELEASLALVEANGHSYGSPSLDVYSFGVLLCETASSTLPNSTADVTGLVRELKVNQLPQISFMVQKCMADNPIQRLAMGELVKKINHLIVNRIRVP